MASPGVARKMPKIVAIGMLQSMFDEPSSGSQATASSPAGIEGQNGFLLFGGVIGGRRLAQRVDDQPVGDDVELALVVAVGVLLPTLGAERAVQGPAGDDVGQGDSRLRQGGDRLREAVRPSPAAAQCPEIRVKAFASGVQRRRVMDCHGHSSCASSLSAG